MQINLLGRFTLDAVKHDMIATGAYFFLRIIEDRLNLKFFEKD